MTITQAFNQAAQELYNLSPDEARAAIIEGHMSIEQKKEILLYANQLMAEGEPVEDIITVISRELGYGENLVRKALLAIRYGKATRQQQIIAKAVAYQRSKH